jgi:hypothetical protein
MDERMSPKEGARLSEEYVTIVIYVPPEAAEQVRMAMCGAGAGTVGDGRYDRVTYTTRCVCRYRVLEGAWDTAGEKGSEYEAEEDRIEAICRAECVEAVVKAAVAVHPYETPAITIYPTLNAMHKYWR